mgnify:CR=1 FL=1
MSLVFMDVFCAVIRICCHRGRFCFVFCMRLYRRSSNNYFAVFYRLVEVPGYLGSRLAAFAWTPIPTLIRDDSLELVWLAITSHIQSQPCDDTKLANSRSMFFQLMLMFGCGCDSSYRKR